MVQALKKTLQKAVPVLFPEQEKLRTLCAMPESALPLDFIVILDDLLEKGASFIKKDNKGITPLSLACKNGNLQAISLFIGRGGDVNLYPLLLTDAVEGQNGPIIELLLQNMQSKSVLVAQKEAHRRGITYAFKEEIEKYAKILSIEKKRYKKNSYDYPEMFAFEAVQPLAKVTKAELLAQFFSFSARKRMDVRTLVALKKAYQRHQKIHFEDVYIDAVMKRLPRTFDFVDNFGAPFLVQDKAFQKIKNTPQEDKFVSNWIDVTDAVCQIRHHRRDVFCRRYRLIKKWSSFFKNLLRKPLNSFEEMILIAQQSRKKRPQVSQKIVLKLKQPSEQIAPAEQPAEEKKGEEKTPEKEQEKTSSSVVAQFKNRDGR